MAVVLAAALTLAGCGSAEPAPSRTPSATSSQPEPTVSEESPSPSASATAQVVGLSYIAQAKGDALEIFDAPDGEKATTVEAADVLTAPESTPLVFLVKERTADWIEVYLPIRPNGSTGWARLSDVTLTSTTLHLVVNLGEFTLKVFDGEDVVLASAIGLGRDELPTPGGVYFIRELLQPPDPKGVYGPFAYGLSGYSPVLETFGDGDAVIGIHGTNDPSSIGKAVSHGCIRLPNEVIEQLVLEIGLPLGTPVVVEAD